ncbi:hypothetical protein [Dyadobacter sp. CY312]|uniref:hypothetical protein n=1 Tax=Dyadobacter sp. CY312 TaxID=2907303 RepID=UPI001F1D5348|nr:hypothetical protein [Dyadobacter sp. CY312]MCE7040530.1 hypothetical protein [Dyadobacter sp. CY312]
MLYSAVTSLLIPIVIFFEDRLEVWQYCIIGLLIIGVATYRYADVLLAGCSYAILFTLLGNLMFKFSLGKALLPFAVMTLALVIYFISKKIRSSYYHSCSKLIQILALLTFYLGGNYYVVREANAVLNNFSASVSPQIAYAGLFYFFTAFIPLAYIFFGLKSKSRILLVTGLVSLAFSFFTVQYYTGYLTIPQALSVAGLIMILLSSGMIHFLKKPVFGISDNQENDNGRLLQIQTLLAAEYLGAPPQQQDGFDFGGGGEFSGGGAGSTY